MDRLGAMPASLPAEWRHWCQGQSARQADLVEKLKPDGVLPLSYAGWQVEENSATRERMAKQACLMCENGTAELLNEPFQLWTERDALTLALTAHTPLWRENYNYLEFLLPLVWTLRVSDADSYPETRGLLEAQVRLFWQLAHRTRYWSTYGVSRRLLVSTEMLPSLTTFSEDFQIEFWRCYVQDARYVVRFLEWDVRGNHLIKNLRAWLSATLILEKLPATAAMARNWWRRLARLLPKVFAEQVLEDGLHFERTPMYHVWALQDLLECIALLQHEKPDYDCMGLKTLAWRMLDAMQALWHRSGQMPLFGDSSSVQVPDLDALTRYGHLVLGSRLGCMTAPEALVAQTYESFRLTHFEEGGFAVLCHERPSSESAAGAVSLILDIGDFGPRCLPAHAHCDLGSFELHVDDCPVIVDSGLSEYVPSLMRDYFRGTAAHNTLWVPGEDQAEIWGGFRVAEYPYHQGCTVESDAGGAKITLVYENHNRRYQHQRSVYGVAGRFFVIQDWLQHLYPADRTCYSLLHVHPDCLIRYADEMFSVGEQLLVVPYGSAKLEWSDQTPWRHNLNLYSPGFSLAQPGKLIAMTPRPQDCFGWVLIPHAVGAPPRAEKAGECVVIEFSDGVTFQVTWDSSGLHAVVLGPAI